VPDLCLVAERDGEVVGHICFSEARLESGDAALALGPMAVVPQLQRHAIGSALVEEALRRASGTDYPLVMVVGHPEYYPKFGFEPADALGLSAPWDIPPEAWMARRLPAYRAEARGLVSYAAPFDAVA
jgi:putative acetyltransferase